MKPLSYHLYSADCNDTNNLIYPGATELCDYLDNDCDGIIDDNVAYILSFEDADGDNYGNILIDSLSCNLPEGFVENNTDCDDTNPNIYPGAEEILNGLDDDCNNLIDEGLATENTLTNTIKIYPNPTNGILFIEWTNANPAQIKLINSSGEIVAIIKKEFPMNKIDMNNYPKGIYLIKTDTEFIGYKIIKE